MASKKRLNKIARQGGYNISENNPHIKRKESNKKNPEQYSKETNLKPDIRKDQK